MVTMSYVLLMAGLLMVQIFATLLGANCRLKHQQPKLRLVNVIFRHGDRTPSNSNTYPNDPYTNYTYYPIGRGGLTNEGKRREYQLGKVLKSRYGDFLGPIYDPSVLVARSSDYERTKISLQLVLSALYPPELIQKWNDELAWQPIPAVYSPVKEDMLFFPDLCPQYIAEYARVQNTIEVKEKIAKFEGLMKSLGEFTGQTIVGTKKLKSLYQTFHAQRSANLTLPEWVYKFYPDGELVDAAILHYEIRSYNDNLKRMYGGTLLREISDNAASYVNGTLEEGRKLYLYSGHELNVASLQLTLGVSGPHVPAYSSAVIIEFWQQEDEYFVKTLQYSGIPSEIIEQQIPGCTILCPFNKFLELLVPVTTTDADLLCL